MYHKNNKIFTKCTYILGELTQEFKQLESRYIFEYIPIYNKSISEDSLFISINQIKNLKLLNNTTINSTIINGRIYVSIEVIKNKGFNLISKIRYMDNSQKRFYELIKI